MKKRLVYIAGPITKPCPMKNANQATRVWNWLRMLGIPAICPHWSVLANLIEPVPYEAWIEYDFILLSHCCALLRLAGESPGADREVTEANQLGIPVFHDIVELYKWWGER